jgi:hypothetical protein
VRCVWGGGERGGRRPAANPRPTDSQKMNCSTNRYTGTAIMGWGSEDIIAMAKVWNLGTPLGTNTKATANPCQKRPNNVKRDLITGHNSHGEGLELKRDAPRYQHYGHSQPLSLPGSSVKRDLIYRKKRPNRGKRPIIIGIPRAHCARRGKR